MVTLLHSDKLNIEINCYFETGNIRNKLPLGREFLIVEVLGDEFKIENGWDLLYTYSVKDINRINSNPNDFIFNKINDVRLALFNGKRCIIVNKVIRDYTLCIIWDVDNQHIDFLCKFIDDYNVMEVLTSDTLISRYPIDIMSL